MAVPIQAVHSTRTKNNYPLFFGGHWNSFGTYIPGNSDGKFRIFFPNGKRPRTLLSYMYRQKLGMEPLLGANKTTKIYWKSTTVHNLLFCANSLCMNYVTKILPLISASASGLTHIVFNADDQEKKREQTRTKRNFVRIHSFFPLSTSNNWRGMPETKLAVTKAHWPL